MESILRFFRYGRKPHLATKDWEGIKKYLSKNLLDSEKRCKELEEQDEKMPFIWQLLEEYTVEKDNLDLFAYSETNTNETKRRRQLKFRDTVLEHRLCVERKRKK
jgi:hypothetical protein